MKKKNPDEPVFEVIATIVIVALMLWAITAHGAGAIMVVFVLSGVLVFLWDGRKSHVLRDRANRAHRERNKKP